MYSTAMILFQPIIAISDVFSSKMLLHISYDPPTNEYTVVLVSDAPQCSSNQQSVMYLKDTEVSSQ